MPTTTTFQLTATDQIDPGWTYDGIVEVPWTDIGGNTVAIGGSYTPNAELLSVNESRTNFLRLWQLNSSELFDDGVRIQSFEYRFTRRATVANAVKNIETGWASGSFNVGGTYYNFEIVPNATKSANFDQFWTTTSEVATYNMNVVDNAFYNAQGGWSGAAFETFKFHIMLESLNPSSDVEAFIESGEVEITYIKVFDEICSGGISVGSFSGLGEQVTYANIDSLGGSSLGGNGYHAISRVLNATVLGGSLFANNSSETTLVSVSIVGSSGIQASGESQIIDGNVFEFDFRWRRNQQIAIDFDFIWNRGDLNLYWYRIVSKNTRDECAPLNECCQKYVFNVSARSLSELAERLAKNRFTFAIESVERFSRPAENSVVAEDEANGVNHDCNVLIPVDISELPQFVPFLVDRNVRIRTQFNITAQIYGEYNHTAVVIPILMRGAGTTSSALLTANYSADGNGTIGLFGSAESITPWFKGTGGSALGGKAHVECSVHFYEADPGMLYYDNSTPEFLAVIEQNNQARWYGTDSFSLFTTTPLLVDFSYENKSKPVLLGNFNLDLSFADELISWQLSLTRVANISGEVRDLEIYFVKDGEFLTDNLAKLGAWSTTSTTITYTTNSLSLSDLIDPDLKLWVRIYTDDPLYQCRGYISNVELTVTARSSNSLPIMLVGSAETITSSSTVIGVGRLTIASSSPSTMIQYNRPRIVSAGTLLSGTVGPVYVEIPTGGVAVGGEAHTSPMYEGNSAVLYLGGAAKTQPLWETMDGGLLLSGDVVCSQVIVENTENGILIGGTTLPYSKIFDYHSSGLISTAGRGRFAKDSHSFITEGNFTVVESAHTFLGHVEVPSIRVRFSASVLDLAGVLPENTDLEVASGATSLVARCGCYEIPLTLELTHNIAENNILGKFLVRNNLGLGQRLRMRYNRSNNSWQHNEHLEGLAADVNVFERWDILFDLRCSNIVGGIEVGQNHWRFGVFINRINLSTGEDYDTRVLFGIDPATICSSSLDKLDFVASFNTINGDLDVTPASIIYDKLIYDNIGLFRNSFWTNDPYLNIGVTQVSSVLPQARVDLTQFVYE